MEVYKGVLSPDGWHDHSRMYREMRSYLDHVESENLWDEDLVLQHLRAIMERYMGKPPTEFTWEGRTYTPSTFVSEYIGIDLDAYVQFMSTKRLPFYRTGLFDVPDNWWRDDTYHNIPLQDFYAVLVNATDNGFTAAIGGDVSEPGKNPEQDIAFIPSFDIPAAFIDQDAREYRIYNHSTGDDHGIHLLARARVAGHDWFLVKDSGRSSRWGGFRGYYFFRDDYVKLKMLTILVHKDAAATVLKKFKKKAQAR